MLAAAYGVPCAVSDELVMVALKLRDGVRFDPYEFFCYCEQQVAHGGMDTKWFRLRPYRRGVRIHPDPEGAGSQSQGVHFDRNRLADRPIYWKRRGDTTDHDFDLPLDRALREDFEVAERLEQLDR